VYAFLSKMEKQGDDVMKMMKVIVLSVMMLCGGFVGQVCAGQVNVNSADAVTLATELKGIGEKKAQAIIDYRKQNGPFTTIYDLENVKGISIKTIENNKDNISL